MLNNLCLYLDIFVWLFDFSFYFCWFFSIHFLQVCGRHSDATFDDVVAQVLVLVINEILVVVLTKQNKSRSFYVAFRFSMKSGCLRKRLIILGTKYFDLECSDYDWTGLNWSVDLTSPASWIEGRMIPEKACLQH